jgi:hypothetical protein
MAIATSPLYGTKTAQAAFALNAPDFGWYYVKYWLDADLRLPSAVSQRSIYLMYVRLWFKHQEDEVAQALEPREPPNAYKRTAVEAYAFCRDLQIPEIAERVGIPSEALNVYYDLFFNVPNRRDEPLYVAQIVYPDTKLSDLRDDGFDPDNIRQNLFRVAYEGGSKALEFELGTRIRTFSSASNMNLAINLEGRILSNARTVARLGGLNSKKAYVGVRPAVGLLQAAHQSGQTADSRGDDVAGLGAIGAARSTLDTVLGIQGREIQERLGGLRATQETISSQ